jgi:hypothetical protein
MAMPDKVNFAKHLLWANFNAFPAGIATLGIQVNKIVFLP